MSRSRFRSFASTFLFATVIAIGGWSISPTATPSHRFEIALQSSVESEAKIYYDQGAGLSEADSVAQPVSPGTNRISLPLPPGNFPLLRFDPINTEGRISIGEARILDPAGRVLRELPAASFSIAHQLQDTEAVSGIRNLVTSPGANDPQLDLRFTPPLQLSVDPWHHVLIGRWQLVGWFLGAFTGLLLARFSWQHRARWWHPAWRFAHRKPRTALALGALLAAVLASYPVVFFGKSFLTPATGILLLYERNPTVPGYAGTVLDDARGADVGALHWAHMPYTVIAGRAFWEEFTVPLWNRYNSSGVTLLGQGQSMIADPLNFLVAIAGGNAWAFDLKFVLCKALFALGLGWCVWLLTRDLAASLLVVAAAAFIGFFNYRVNHPAIFSVSYSPWILAGWLQVIRAPDNRALARAIGLWLVAAWMLLTSGTVKEAYLLFGTLNLTGLVGFLLHPMSAAQKLRRALPVAITGLAFILATAPLWWTFLDALKSAQTFYDTPTIYQTPRALFIGLFDDLFYLEVIAGRGVYNASANFLLLLGCLCALVQARRLLTERFALTLLLALAASVALVFGWVPAAWLVELPFLRNVHHIHVQFSCIAIVHGAILAGWGFSAARRPLAAGHVGRYLFVLATFLTGCFYAYFAGDPNRWNAGQGFAGWKNLIPEHAFFYVNALLLPLALGCLLWIAARHLRGRALTGAWTATALLALTIVLARHGQHLPLDTPTRFIRTPGPRADLLASSPAVEHLRDAVATEPNRILGTGHTLFTGFSAVYGFEGINGPDAVFNPHYRELLLLSHLVPPPAWHIALDPSLVAARRPLLDYFNVRYLVTPVGTVLNSPYHQKVASLDLDIYRGETAWPRAFFVNQLERYDTPADFITLLYQRAAGLPFAAVQSHDAEAQTFAPTNHTTTHTVSVPATTFALSSNTTAFTVEAPAPGFVVLHETWSRDDFRATLNGEPVPYFRANHTFKAIAIPSAGVHRIAFTYWPRHYTESLLLCAAGATILASLLILVHRGSFRFLTLLPPGNAAPPLPPP